jgi:type I restriction enzyme S subunit
MNNSIGLACNIKTGKLDANKAVKGGPYPFFTCAEYPDEIDHFAFDDDVVLIAGNNAQGNFHVSRYTGKFNAYQRTYVLTAKEGFNIDYVYYALKLELKRLREKSQGSQTKFLTMPILTGINLKNLNLHEQTSISKVLRVIDDKIDCNNRINEKLESLAKLLYDYWFIQFDFPDANGKPYKSNGGKMVFNASLNIEIPAAWNDGTLNDLGRIVGGSTPSTVEQNNFTENGTPWITPYDLSANQGNKFVTRGGQDVSEHGIKDASLKILPAGTVLLSSRAPIGYMAIARNEVTTNQGFKSFISNDGFSTEYIYYTVNRSLKTIIQYSSGSTFKEVSAGVLKTVKIVLPELNTIKAFTSLVNPFFKRQDELELENQQLSELRDWLLPMLMNGQVTVS